MNLPKLETPIFLLTIPSTGKEIKYRPFLVKEEKILLIAMEEAQTNPSILFETVNELVKNCTFDQVKVDDLTTFDLEYIFLQLRIKSKGSTVDLTFRCTNVRETDNKICDYISEVQINLEDVKVSNLEEFSKNKKIILDEKTNLGLVMKCPTFTTMKVLQKLIAENKNDVNQIYNTIPDYIDHVFQGDTIYDSFTKSELIAWIDQLNHDQFKKIEAFFETMPKLKTAISMCCPGCSKKDTIEIEGLQSFLV